MACDDCPRACPTRGAGSYCGTSRPGRVYWHGVTCLEEHELAPTYEVYFTGCSLRCRFCTVPEAIYRPDEGEWMEPEALVDAIAAPEVPPFRAVSLVGGDPTVNLPYVRPLVTALRARLPGTALVLNTNLYFRVGLAAELAATFDVVVGDVHFWAPGCAGRLAGARDYPGVAIECARALLDAGGRLFLRVLVLPGHLECCARPTIEWAATLGGDLTLHVMTHYAPAGRARGDGELGRALGEDEISAARAMVPAGVRAPRTSPLPDIPRRTARHRDAAAPAEVDLQGRALFPFVTGDLLPTVVAFEPSLAPRMVYVNNSKWEMSKEQEGR